MFVSKVLPSTVKVLDAKTFRVEATMSTENEDRDGDKIMSAGWDLSSFLKHPVLLSSHDYYSLGSQIGEWEDVKAADGVLKGVARYYAEMGNPEADWGWKLASMGKAAYSVGFIPQEWKEIKSPNPAKGFWGSYIYEKQELLETSHVTIPSNREALQLMAKGMQPGPMLDLTLRALGDVELWKGQGEPAQKDMTQCAVPGCDDMASSRVDLCADHLYCVAMLPPDFEAEEDGENGSPNMLAFRMLTHLKAGRTMSAANLDKLHAAMDHLSSVHAGTCDLGDDCPAMKLYKAVITRAAWDTAYINDLPDSAFAYVEPGGEKDADGRTTPRSLRHFPHHDAEGKLDKDHVDNAAARIPQSDVSDAAKARAEAHIKAHQRTLGEDTSGSDDGKAPDLAAQLIKAAQAGFREVVNTHG